MKKTNQIEKNVKRRIKIKKRIGTIVLAVLLLFLVNIPDSLIARLPDKVIKAINLVKQYVPASVVGMLDLIFILMIVFSLLSILINRIALARSTEDYDDEDYEEDRRNRKEEKRAEREAAEKKKRQKESRRKEQEKKSSSNKKRDAQKAKQQEADKKADRERKEEQKLAKEREKERERMRNRDTARERENEPPRQRTTTARTADGNTDGYVYGATRQPGRAVQPDLLTRPVEQGRPMERKPVSVNTLQEELQVEDILADTQKELGSVASVEDDNFLKNDVAEIMKNM